MIRLHSAEFVLLISDTNDNIKVDCNLAQESTFVRLTVLIVFNSSGNLDFTMSLFEPSSAFFW